MARIHKLSARKVATAAPGKYGDGGGLWLHVRKDGNRAWTFRFMIAGRAHEMGLGPVSTVSLAEARREALECRKLLRDGRDPLQVRRERRSERLGGLTFRQCAEAFLTAHRASWRNAKHRQQWENTLASYAYPVFGDAPVGAVDTAAVMRALDGDGLWRAKPETMSRLRGRIERVLDWAAVRGYRDGDNPARWRGHLQALLPARAKVRAVEHLAALAYADVPAFMTDLRQREDIGARALEFTILTAARSGEVLGMTWDEVGGDAWTVPAERTKTRREHRVPLSGRALEILDGMKRLGAEGLVFPGARSGKPLSDTTMTAVLKRMGWDGLTVHGFRSTFRDWAAECTAFPREVCEQALAHALADKVEAAYRRGDLFTKRCKLMDAWAASCARPAKPGEVTPIRGSAA